tara:strand:+ start:53532 stop:53636 length:105 start_codon:yes stop_codon:yes gene_type:complete
VNKYDFIPSSEIAKEQRSAKGKGSLSRAREDEEL